MSLMRQDIRCICVCVCECVCVCVCVSERMCMHLPITLATSKVKKRSHNYARRNIFLRAKYEPKFVVSVEDLLYELCSIISHQETERCPK